MKQGNVGSSMLIEVRRFIDFLDSLTEEKRKALACGEQNIIFSLSNNNKKGKTIEGNLDNSEVEKIIVRLKDFSDREEAENYLVNMQLSRENYKNLVKALDLPYNKKENIGQMCAKIIEGTVGYRLRSETIHGEPLF